ncbi:hypothetical protein U1Q18_042839 [Sarracenia purpurea var. burkii]
MSAFKAANPDAVFEDFIRWHSPRDWENDYFEESGVLSTSDATEGLKKDWPPQGRLSERMSEHGNSWRNIWDDAPALPASEQKLLSDPNREGEKVKLFRVHLCNGSYGLQSPAFILFWYSLTKI